MKYFRKIWGLGESQGFPLQLQDIQEISQNVSQETNLLSLQNSCEPLKEPYQVNEETISKLQQDLNKTKLKLKRVPGTTDWVPYEDIKKFPQTTEEDWYIKLQDFIYQQKKIDITYLFQSIFLKISRI